MNRGQRWRVRVKRTIEDWVEITAATKEAAEAQASTLPGVVYVLSKMTISGEKPVGQMINPSIEDSDD